MLDLRNTGFPVIYLRMAVLVASVGALSWAVLLWMGEELEALLIRLCQRRLLGKWGFRATAEQSIRQLFRSLSIVRLPRAAAKLLSISAVVWLCEGGVFAAVATCLHYAGTAFGPWFALTVGSLATMLPSAPGYVGTFELFTASGFAVYGVDRAAAVAMALAVHIVLWAPITGAGLAYLVLVCSKGRRGQLLTRAIREEERL
jgi:uncharacterized membrane protein YbhN (UPF0104 family)